MRLIAYFVVIATFLAVQANLTAASGADDATASKPEQQSASDTLPGRVYPLKHIASIDLSRMIEHILSKQGKIDILQTDHDIVVVQDHEEILKIIDRIVAEVDVQPKQVLIEAMIVRVDAVKSSTTEAGSSILDRVDVNAQVVNKGIVASLVNATSAALSDKPVDTDIAGVGKQAETIKFGYLGGDTTQLLHALQSLGETKVLACPRLLVLNKQRAEIFLGDCIVDQAADQDMAHSSPTIKSSNDGTRLRVQPFVASDGMIRLELHIHHHQQDTDSTGVPATDATQITTNIIMSDGETVVIGGLTGSEAASSDKDTAADSTTKKEVLVIVTSRLWKPKAIANASRPGSITSEEQPTITR